MKTFTRTCIVYILLIALLLLSFSAEDSLKKSFLNPPASARPHPLWFWNNTEVTIAGIREQMKGFSSNSGYGGFGILPFGKNFKPEYLSEDYFNVYGEALRTAGELGLQMYLYDEYGFPSGSGGAINGDGNGRFKALYPDQTIKRLDKTEEELIGPAVYRHAIPPGHLMASVAMETKTKERIDLSGFIRKDTLVWQVPHGQWKIMFFTCVTDGDPDVDYLDPEAVHHFIQMTHEAYYRHFKSYFGKVITGTFFDEPTMYRANGRMWTSRFNDKFKQRYGFNPALLYPALWYNIGEETRLARNYLFGFRTELYASGFMKEVSDWSTTHGIHATGHQDQEEVLNPVSVSGDLMKCCKYLDIPGIDKIGGNRPAEHFYKIISSAAYNWDKTLVMSETYGAMGNLHMNELYAIAMEQYTKGINMLIPHAVWYDTSNVTFLPELSYRNSLYADSLPTFTRYLSRLNVMLQKPGRHVADIAMLYPIQTLQGEHYLDGPLGYYRGGVDIPGTNYIDTGILLSDSIGMDYTWLHPEILDGRCIVEGNELVLQNQVNKEQFKVLVFPGCSTISRSNLMKAKAFYEAGGNLIFISQLPEYDAEQADNSAIAQMIRDIFGNRTVLPAQDTVVKNQRGGKAFFILHPDQYTLENVLHQACSEYDVEMPAREKLRYIHKVIGNRNIYFLANPGDQPINTHIRLRSRLKLEAWDPHSGAITTPKVAYEKQGENTRTIISISLAPCHSMFLVQE